MERIAASQGIKSFLGTAAALKREVPTLMLSAAGFLIGRAALFEYMNPLCLAFLSNFIGSDYRLYILAISIATGILTKFEGLLIFKNLSAIVIIVAAHMISGMAGIRIRGFTARIIAGFASVFSGILFAFLYDRSLYYIVMAIAEGFFVTTLAVVMTEGTQILSGKLKGNIIDSESIISLAVIFGSITAGAADIYIGSVSLKYVLCVYTVLEGSRRGGAGTGALCGVVLGFILTLMGYFNYSLIGVLSVGAVVCAIFRKGGKPASIAGFLAGGLLSAIYIDPALLNKVTLYSVLPAIILFYITPENFTFGANTINVSKAIIEAAQSKSLAEQKLRSLSATFRNMGRTLYSLAEKKPSLSQKDISALIDDAAAKACAECAYKSECWERSFYKTYQMSFSLIEICEQNDGLRLMDVPNEYKHMCFYMEHYISWLSRLLDIYKLNLNWKNQIAESKELVSQQLVGVSQIIEDLADEIKTKEVIIEDLEEKIVLGFLKKGIEVKNVIVVENAYGKYSVTMERRACAGRKSCLREMAVILTKAVGRKMVSEKKVCAGNEGQTKCALKFIEEARLHVVSGAASHKKDSSITSGDCHSVMEIKGGQVILALSDGMGSGRKARAESEAAMDLLEDFLSANFSKELALKLINSVLVLKSGEESFSTMDICAIDLHSGTAEFVKIGAASTFIKRNGQVAQIVSESLPMGILNEIDLEVSKKIVKDGDLIVMVTDGVYDSGDDSLGKNWVQAALEEFEGFNPQDVADYILGLSMKRSGEIIKDDMTVLCARIWEKAK